MNSSDVVIGIDNRDLNKYLHDGYMYIIAGTHQVGSKLFMVRLDYEVPGEEEFAMQIVNYAKLDWLVLGTKLTNYDFVCKLAKELNFQLVPGKPRSSKTKSLFPIYAHKVYTLEYATAPTQGKLDELLESEMQDIESYCTSLTDVPVNNYEIDDNCMDIILEP